MLSDEEVAGIKWCYGGSGCDDCPASTCVGAEETIVAALLSDRAELQAEIERWRTAARDVIDMLPYHGLLDLPELRALVEAPDE